MRTRSLRPVTGPPVPLPDPERLVHVQFRRFAGCPVCHLHLRSFVRRHGEIEAAGVREVVVFHSPDADLRRHVADLPFPVIGDPDRRMYQEFGVEAAPRALLHPRAWPGLLRATWAVVRGGERKHLLRPHGGRFGLPGDFLIAPDGRVLAHKYGTHADDQWSVDELLALVHGEADRSTAAG